METIDSQLPRALDGGAGGSYAPSGIIIIGGSGLAITGPFFAATGDFSDPVEFHDTVQLDGVTLAVGSLHFGGSTIHHVLSGATLTTDSGAILSVASGGVLNFVAGGTITGTPKFNAATVSFEASSTVTILNSSLTLTNCVFTISSSSSVTCHANATIDGVCDFTGAVIAGTPTLTAVVTPSGSGRMRIRRVAGVNADHTYAIADGDVVDIPTLTGTRTYTVSSTGAGNGDTMEFTMASDNTSAANGVVLIRGDLTQIGPSVVKNTHTSVKVIWDGTKWQPKSWSN